MSGLFSLAMGEQRDRTSSSDHLSFSIIDSISTVMYVSLSTSKSSVVSIFYSIFHTSNSQKTRVETQYQELLLFHIKNFNQTIKYIFWKHRWMGPFARNSKKQSLLVHFYVQNIHWKHSACFNNTR